ncbi:FecR family protein [Patescibacteria group bacterium]|nr:FecR family protein [Patescibacteria group bacterium]
MQKIKILKIIALFGLVVLIAGAGFFVVQDIKNKEKEKINLEQLIKEQALAPKPWLEVISSQAIKKNSETGEFLMELKTGDELSQGETIETNEAGLAIIHFPDGSVARLEENSSLVIEESSFDEKSESLKVRIKLKLGRVWCRVIQLVTADSFWEVKTSNVVATVRGTSFGIEHSEKGSSVIVDEGKVEGEAFDSDTNKKIEGTKTILEKNKIIEIKKEKIKELKIKPEKLVVKEIPREILLEKWIERNKQADIKFNENIKKLEDRGLEIMEIKKELEKEFKEKIEEIRKQRQEEKQRIIKLKPELETQPKIEQEKDQLKTEQKIEDKKIEGQTDNLLPDEIIQKQEIGGTEIKPKNLVIIMPKTSAILIENDILNLKAILTMTDGVKKDVTEECQWKVLGKIGIIKAPGVFVAKLDSSISELGQAPGQIVCTWSDPKTNEAFLGSSPVINVKAKTESDFEIRG